MLNEVLKVLKMGRTLFTTPNSAPDPVDAQDPELSKR